MENNNQQNRKIIKSNEIPDIDFYNAYKDLPNEKWEELTFPDNIYEISNYGRLKSYAVNENGMINKNGSIANYLTTTFKILGKEKLFFIHKLVAEYFVLKDDNSQNIVIHLDNDRRNNYYENLKWANAKESFEHNEKFNLKLHEGFRKNKVSAAKITRQDANNIRNMIKEGILQSVIAKKYKISEMQITRIKRNENWVETPEKKKTTRKRLQFVKTFSTDSNKLK